MAKKLYGTDPDQVPTNADLGTMAYQNKDSVTVDTLGVGTRQQDAEGLRLLVAHDGHGIGIDYVGALPAQAGIFTSGTAHTQTAYGDLNIKARTDYGGYYGIGFFTASSNNTPVRRAYFNSTGNLAFESGKGIDFSATAGGGTEIFNDYETGLWQPEIYYQNASDQAAATETVQAGRYTKIGNLVTCAFRLDWNPPSSPANDNIGVKNFPFPGQDNHYNAQGVLVGTCSVAGIQLAQLSAGGTMALILTTSGGGNLGDDFGNTSGRYIRGTITYHTNS